MHNISKGTLVLDCQQALFFFNFCFVLQSNSWSHFVTYLWYLFLIMCDLLLLKRFLNKKCRYRICRVKLLSIKTWITCPVIFYAPKGRHIIFVLSVRPSVSPSRKKTLTLAVTFLFVNGFTSYLDKGFRLSYNWFWPLNDLDIEGQSTKKL